ncbi:MAG: 2-isopropylmalate synthase [Deltaproteobacteria bacterium]|nr:MAG: 2-isopropylmalate synthase [Deltaproteobacteria bacterium]
MDEQSLIFDWNEQPPHHQGPPPKVEVHDETIRDGIQCPSVTDPSLDQKLAMVRMLSELGVHSSDLALPGAGQRATDDCRALVELIRDEKLSIRPAAAGRTLAADVRPILELSEQTGVPIEAMLFLGTSPIRLYAEGWDGDRLERLTREAVRMGVQGGIPVSFVTEDTVRSRPETLARLFEVAVEEGADRLVLCDTVGHATPAGVRNLVAFTHDLLLRWGVRDTVRIDWHQHEDRGLSLINTLVAVEAGADRVHGTILGVGERVGNTPLDQLLVNLKLMGAWEGDLSALGPLCDLVSEATQVPIPVGYPVFGSDAFRTGTGVHAAAVIKAHRKGDHWLADRIYSGVPAAWFGRQQQIEIGHQSGLSNVKFWLKQRDLPQTDEVVHAIFELAKAGDGLLDEPKILEVVERVSTAER